MYVSNGPQSHIVLINNRRIRLNKWSCRSNMYYLLIWKQSNFILLIFFYKAWSPHIYNVIMMICLILIYVKIFWTICHDLCCSNFCNNEKELSAISDCSVVCIFEQSQLICIVSTQRSSIFQHTSRLPYVWWFYYIPCVNPYSIASSLHDVDSYRGVHHYIMCVHTLCSSLLNVNSSLCIVDLYWWFVIVCCGFIVKYAAYSYWRFIMLCCVFILWVHHYML